MFGKRITLFKIFGFEVRIDASWLFLAFLVTWSLTKGYFPTLYPELESKIYWIMGLLGAFGLFASLLIHEMSHSVVARSYGIPIKGITLFIFGGVAELESEPKSAKSEFWMAIAGPIASGVLSGLFYGLYQYSLSISADVMFEGVFRYLAMINGLLALFNLLPGFPLDGGRILRSILWGWSKNLKWATSIAVRGGTSIATIMMIFGVLQLVSGNIVGGIWWFVISLFLRFAAQSTQYQMWLSDTLTGESVARFAVRNPVSITPDWTLDRVINELVYKTYHKFYPVVDRSGLLLGSLSTAEIKAVPPERWSQVQVDDVFRNCTDENCLESSVDAMQALQLMNKSKKSRMLVVDQGQLIGVVTLKDLMAYLATRMEFGSTDKSGKKSKSNPEYRW